MKKHRLLQIPPIRFGVVLGLINGLIGLLVAPIILLAGGVIAATEAPKLLGIPWLFVGAGALFMPLIHAVGGFLVGILLAMAYNFAARWTGGIELVLEEKP
ncbi:MAG: hypothetical protein EXS34_00410 [Lacunisphaera sp.]|jgi:hypothetical protein|nr:hypothetical protein [Lacunisphaera sp.]PAW83893.1 MAG: hypothetical protein B9S28_06310 [Opitutae bacterium Tous-C10FEB]